MPIYIAPHPDKLMVDPPNYSDRNPESRRMVSRRSWKEGRRNLCQKMLNIPFHTDEKKKKPQCCTVEVQAGRTAKSSGAVERRNLRLGMDDSDAIPRDGMERSPHKAITPIGIKILNRMRLGIGNQCNSSLVKLNVCLNLGWAIQYIHSDESHKTKRLR